MFTQPKILLISSAETESKVLEEVLSEHVNLHPVRNLQDLEIALENGSYSAVFCGWSCHKGAQDSIFQTMRRTSPDLPVVVFCGTGGEREWTEVLEAGGFDLLVPPYQKSKVLPVLAHAIVSGQARRFHREMSHSTANTR